MIEERNHIIFKSDNEHEGFDEILILMGVTYHIHFSSLIYVNLLFKRL